MKLFPPGFPSFCRQVLASLCTVLLNWAVKSYGDGALAAMGVVQKVFMFAFSIALGVGQGYQPVLGYNYSARFFGRVRSAYLFTLAFSTSLMTIFCHSLRRATPAIMREFLESPDSIAIRDAGASPAMYLHAVIAAEFYGGAHLSGGGE